MEDLNNVEMASINPNYFSNKKSHSIITKLHKGSCDPATCCCGCSCAVFLSTVTAILGSLAGLAYLIYYLVNLSNGSNTTTTTASPIG